MAGGKSDYLEKALLDQVFGGTPWTPPATLYFALFTDTNTTTQRDANTVTEVSTVGTGYARVGVTNNSTNFPASTGTTATKTVAADVIFPAATSSWGTVNAFGVYDAPTGGNLLSWGDLTAPMSVPTGKIVDFPASTGLTFTED